MRDHMPTGKFSEETSSKEERLVATERKPQRLEPQAVLLTFSKGWREATAATIHVKTATRAQINLSPKVTPSSEAKA